MGLSSNTVDHASRLGPTLEDHSPSITSLDLSRKKSYSSHKASLSIWLQVINSSDTSAAPSTTWVTAVLPLFRRWLAF